MIAIEPKIIRTCQKCGAGFTFLWPPGLMVHADPVWKFATGERPAADCNGHIRASKWIPDEEIK